MNISRLISTITQKSNLQCDCEANTRTSEYISLFLNFSQNIVQNDLINHIQVNLMQLCQNVFGRRVVQCVLQYGNIEHRTQIYEKINADVLLLAQDRLFKV